MARENTHFQRHTVNSLYSGHCRDLKLVSSVARVRNSGSLFQSNVCNLFLPGIYLLSVLSGCPLQRGVRKARVDCTWVCFAFKHLLQCSDDRSLPLVEEICDLMGFRAANRLRVDKVWTAACFSVLSLLRFMKRVAKGHTLTAKKQLN